MSDRVPMTLVGKTKMEEELKKLKTVERPAVIQAIAVARAHGDLSENAEYDAAKEKQSFVEGRIAELEDKLARAQVVDTSDLKTDKIVFGATVELMNCDTEQKQTYRIVGSDESDVKLGLVSIESPIARQLLNKKAGDQVVIKVPKGDIEYEILSVKYQ
jgi:transcription elongation factor GreA